MIELTKRWRCFALATKVAAFDPEFDCIGIGATVVNRTFCPYYFDTDSQDEMQAWLAENEILIDPTQF